MSAKKRKPDVTPWFPADVKPVHAGAYELQGVSFAFHYWDGKQWLHLAEGDPKCITKQLIRKAGPISEHISYIKRCPWRGLASDPSKVPA